MSSKQIRISVEVLARLKKKLIAEGQSPFLVEKDLAHYVDAALEAYLEGKLIRSEPLLKDISPHQKVVVDAVGRAAGDLAQSESSEQEYPPNLKDVHKRTRRAG